jgi:hypothetical protein
MRIHIYIWLGVCIIVAIYGMGVYGYDSWLARKNPIITCGVEQSWAKWLYENGRYFAAAATRSTDVAHTGNYAVKLGTGYSYGLGYTWEVPPKAGTRVEVAVWRYNADRPGVGVLVAKTKASKPIFLLETDTVRQLQPDGWQLLRDTFVVPPGLHDPLEIFAFVQIGKGCVYFDDLSITCW